MEYKLQRWTGLLLAGVLLVTLAGCAVGGVEPTATPASEFEAYRSAVLDDAYEDALPASTQLALGILLLEDTEQAVTAEQAALLLPLWQALQAGTLQGGAETNAVLAQVERSLTAGQLQAIAGMKLTRASMQSWAEEHGLAMAAPPEGAGGAGPGGPAGQGQGGLSTEARETMRAERESLSPEELEQRRAERQATAGAGGMTVPEGGGGFPGGENRAGGGRAGVGQVAFLLQPLIELLTGRVNG